MKRLAVVTGSRAEYGVLRPFLRLAWESKVFELQLIVAGMHLLPQFGKTVREIKADGYRISWGVPMTGEAAYALGHGITGFAGGFRELKPDLILVEGDRVEVLAATLAAGYMGIPVAHGGGGCITRTIDNAARHAISHFASLHFAETDDARERLVRMGCDPATIHVTGALGVDAIMQTEFRPREEVLDDLGLPAGSRYLLVVFHPESERVEQAGEDMDAILRACYATGLLVVVVYPNSDPGSAAIMSTIKRHSAHAFPSLSSSRYLNALKQADVLVGNSSGGLLEAPSLRVPVVNVGQRQRGRLEAANVIDCGPDWVDVALRTALGMDCRDVVNPYGDAHAAERMMAVIEGRLEE